MKQKLSLLMIALSITFILTACPLDSPMEMQFQITPEPVVGKEVLAVIKLRSNEEAPHTILKLDASDDIHFSFSELEFAISLPKNEWEEFKVPFTVSKEGEHTITAYAFNSYRQGSDSGFGTGKTLYIRSDLWEADVTEKQLSK